MFVVERNHDTVLQESGVEVLICLLNGDHSEDIQRIVVGAIANLAVTGKTLFYLSHVCYVYKQIYLLCFHFQVTVRLKS